jgi:hypothetical protein
MNGIEIFQTVADESRRKHEHMKRHHDVPESTRRVKACRDTTFQLPAGPSHGRLTVRHTEWTADGVVVQTRGMWRIVCPVRLMSRST